MELILYCRGEGGWDPQRFSSVLEAPETFTKIWLACTQTLPGPELSSFLARQSLTPEFVSAPNAVRAVNRALLGSAGDVLVSFEGLLDVPGYAAALEDAAKHHDRAGIVVPAWVDSTLSGAEIVARLAGTSLPRATAVATSDSGTVLLRRTVINMIGALDPELTDWPDALADYSMRALRLGFETVVAHRALVRSPTKRRCTLPIENPPEALTRKHPCFTAHQALFEGDYAPMLATRALTRKDPVEVCLDIRYLPEGAINGTGVYALELARALVKHTPSNVTLWVDTEAQRASVERLGLPIVQGAEAPARLDVLHRPAQVFEARHLAGLLSAPAPLVITFQDLIAWRAASTFRVAEEHARYRNVSYLAVRSAQALIAISEHNRGELIRELHIPEEDVRTVHHGVHVDSFKPMGEAEDRARLKPHDIPRSFFFYVGSDYAHKNLRLLLASYASLRKGWRNGGIPPALVMVGHPSGSIDAVYPLLREHPLPGVTYLPGVSQSVLESLYRQAIAVLYPSAYEGFGLPILEAMAAGTPVLGSSLSSIPEVGGDAALYLQEMSVPELRGRMEELAQSPELRKELVGLGRQRVKEFTWEKTAHGTFAVYQQVLERPSARSLFDRRMARELWRYQR